MRITDILQPKEKLHTVSSQNNSASGKTVSSRKETTAKTQMTERKEAAAKMQMAEDGATVTISAEGLGLSQSGMVSCSAKGDETEQRQKDKEQQEKEAAMQDAQMQTMYQEMMEAQKEAAENGGEGFADLAKALEIARRILNGDIVPKEDEQFLMEYNSEMYMRVKSMAQQKDDPEEYDSLLEEEEEGGAKESKNAGSSKAGNSGLAETAEAEPVAAESSTESTQ